MNQDAIERARYPRGRPFGSCNLGSKQPSALACAFKKAGLNWRMDFAQAIMKHDAERIAFWERMLPYMTSTNPGPRQNGGYLRKRKPSRAALEQLAQLEQIDPQV